MKFTIQLGVPPNPVFFCVSILTLLNPKSVNFAFPSESNKTLEFCLIRKLKTRKITFVILNLYE